MITGRRVGLAVSCSLVSAGLAVAGCSSTPPGGAAPSPSVVASSPVASPTLSASGSATSTPSGSAASTPAGSPSATPSASASAAPGSPSASTADSSAVKRGSATGQDDVDVLVTLDYRSEKVEPEAPDVQIRQGDRVKVVLTSDTAADIVVSGHPDDGADVDPGESEDIDFTVTDAGTTTVTLRQPKIVLATFTTGG